MRLLLGRLWNSPTGMTYGNFLVRSAGWLLLLPFAMVRLGTEEISAWFLFNTIVSLQLLMDMGFSPNFSRSVSYAMGGAGVDGLARPRGDSPGQPNWDSVARIWSTMAFVYGGLALAWMLVLATLGSLAVHHPLSLLDDPGAGWLAWIAVVAVTTTSMFGFTYSAFLVGADQVARVQRLGMATGSASVVSGIAVLWIWSDLLTLVLVTHGWLLVQVLGLRRMSRSLLKDRVRPLPRVQRDPVVFAAVWSGAWRTGVGVVTGVSLVQMTGIVYAQVADAASAASWFLALRLIQAVNQFSQAPFYSRLPLMARLYSEGRREALVELAQQRMRLAYAAFVVPFVALGVAGDPLLRAIGSNADFPDSLLWGLLGLAYFLERYGAMHLQLYSTTNVIVHHIANSGAGLLFVAGCVVVYPWIGLNAFPLALIAGNAGFYCWYSAWHSYREFAIHPWKFERTNVLPPLCLVLLYELLVFSLQK